LGLALIIPLLILYRSQESQKNKEKEEKTG